MTIIRSGDPPALSRSQLTVQTFKISNPNSRSRHSMGQALYSLAVALQDEIETPKPETEIHKGGIPGTQAAARDASETEMKALPPMNWTQFTRSLSLFLLYGDKPKMDLLSTTTERHEFG
jgi:hypothetical protein